MTQHQHKRKMINFLLQPFVQLRTGLITVLIAVIGFIIVGLYVYGRMADFSQVVATLTESDAAISELMRDYLRSTGAVALGIVAVALTINLLFSIYFTHKMVGPTVAFRRHLKQLQSGEYDKRCKLRKGDAFIEVQDELNALADELEKRHGASKKAS